MKNIILLLCAILLLSCTVFDDDSTLEPSDLFECKNYDFTFSRLPFENLHYSTSSVFDYLNISETDEDGIRLWHYNGSEEAYYHPVVLAWDCLLSINSYLLTDEDRFLDYAKHVADFMNEIGYSVDNTIYFKYEFDFPLHGDHSDLMVADWYSGMAQGMFLSTYSRLYYLTNDSHYKELAEKVFNSFKRTEDIWTVFVSSSNYYWISEYPTSKTNPNYTLNGFMYGIYGLYDYWYVFDTNESEVLLSSSLTTLKDHVLLFRRTDDVSVYCLKHQVQSEFYHGIHVEQLHFMSLFTNDQFFLYVSELFRQDHS